MRFINSFNILIVIGLIILAFLIFREVLMWYWKINEVIHLLKKIEKNTGNKLDLEKTGEELNTPTPRLITRPISFHFNKQLALAILGISLLITAFFILFKNPATSYFFINIFK